MHSAAGKVSGFMSGARLELEVLAERRKDGGGRLRAQPARKRRAAADQQAVLDGPQILRLNDHYTDGARLRLAQNEGW